MASLFRPLKNFSRGTVQQKFRFYIHFTTTTIKHLSYHSIVAHENLNINNFPAKNFGVHLLGRIKTTHFAHSLADSDETTKYQRYPDDEIVEKVRNVLKIHGNSSREEVENALRQCELELSDELVISVVKLIRFDWKLVYMFFKWASRDCNYSPGTCVYNEILDILGRMRRLEELIQVFDEMSTRKGLVNEKTYGVLLNRYAAAHKVEEAIGIFNKRKEFGLENDIAFQSLLMWLCRYKHVEDAERFFESKKNEFGSDIKARNIILHGWCVLGNVYEAKRFWKDIIASKCQPDLVTYGTFINALTKKGKLGTAMKLFRAMWEKGCKPDVAICNCIIDALCFKKRISEAFEVFHEMSGRGCLPNVRTYNIFIKYLCKIQRMEKVYELFDEMEQKNRKFLPDDMTYNCMLKSLKKPEQVPKILESMERNGCKMSGDTYNLILKLYVKWGCKEKVRETWDEMEKRGMGPDERSYTIMIHGLYDKGKSDDALSYFREMVSKGMAPGPRTNKLVTAMEWKDRRT